MKIVYHNNKTEKICNDVKKAYQELGKVVATKLFELINMIDSANNLHDLYIAPQYRLHALTGNRLDQYSFVIHKGSKWRLIVYPMDKDGNILKDKSNETEMLIKSVMVEILEVSEHYD